MAQHKAGLPEKACLACGRPFAWRKKWAKTWDEVRYCSDACRTGRRDAARARLGQEAAAPAGSGGRGPKQRGG